MAVNTNDFVLYGTDNIEASPGLSGHVDLNYGNHGGLVPRIGGLNVNGNVFEEYLAGSSYVKQPLIPVLLSFPDYMNKIPDNSTALKYMFKSLVETAYTSFGGFNAKWEVVTEEHQLGNSQETMEEVMDVQRSKSSISYSFHERAGKPIQRLLNHVIRYGMMDPDTKIPLIRNFLTQEELSKVYLPNMYRFCAIYIEPDRTMTQCIDAFLGVNMFFKSSGERDGGRDNKQRTKLVDYDIEVSSIVLNNENVISLGDKILKSMSIHSMTPQDILGITHDNVDADVVSVKTGYDFNPNRA